MPITDLEMGAAIWLIEAWELKEKRGAEWCRRKKVGMVRRALARPVSTRPDVVITSAGARRPAEMYESALCLLRLHCRACGACDLGSTDPN